MQFTLIDYQERAALDILKRLSRAVTDFDDDGERTAVVLTAPTASGKTVIATAVLETLLQGGDLGEPQEGVTVLWVTDDPSLNEQTKRKIAIASDANLPMEVIRTTSNFDQETLDAGTIYFLNIQALSKSSTLVKAGNSRTWSLWDTLDNTVALRGRNFLVIVDEAHKGTKPDSSEASIVQRIIGGEHPVPVVLGISATASKFLTAVEAGKVGQRTIRPVEVSMEDVRASGLVKDRIVLYSPDDDDHEVNADTTLLRDAVRRVREYEKRWADYLSGQAEETVAPALIVQVADNCTDAALREIYGTVISEWPGVNADSFVNTFSEHTPRLIGGGTVIRYMRPHLIQDVPTVRVILAKNAITTGWDCPRAEVLVSFRTAKDATYIAQLIGRIVRQPLARRIGSDGFLNQVYAVLPNFDDDEVDRVANLFNPGSETSTGADAVRATVASRPTPGAEDALASLVTLPSYQIPGHVKVPQVKRLHALAAELARDGLLADARVRADLALHAELNKQAELHATKLAEREQRVSQVRISSSVFDTSGTFIERVDSGFNDIDANNVTDMFKAADRALKDGLGMSYWQYLTASDDADVHTAQIRVAALGSLPEVPQAADKTAGEQVAAWLKEFGKAISDLPDARRQAYDRIRGEASSPELTTITAPRLVEESIPVGEHEDSDAAVARVLADAGNRWQKHLVSSEVDNRYWVDFKSSWERVVLDTELAGGAAWWYRNPGAGRQSLSIPYVDGGRVRGLHPDFIFWKEVGGQLRPYIVDPHGQNNADSEPKLRGLITYADAHAGDFHAINPVIAVDGVFYALALQHSTVRANVTAALDGKKTIEQVFTDHGEVYAKA